MKNQLHPTEDGEGEPNGEVAAADIVQLQKENRELEQQIAEKNKVRMQLIDTVPCQDFGPCYLFRLSVALPRCQAEHGISQYMLIRGGAVIQWGNAFLHVEGPKNH